MLERLKEIFHVHEMGGEWCLAVMCHPGWGPVGPWRKTRAEAEQDRAALIEALEREFAAEGPRAS